jgi:hypothetical protein
MAPYAAGYRLYFGNLSCRYRRVQVVPCPVPGQMVQYLDKLTDIYISHTGRLSRLVAVGWGSWAGG